MFRSQTPLFSDLENDSVPAQCQVIYTDPATVPLLIGLLEAEDTSATHQIAACDVLTSCCRSTEHQNSLVASGLLTSLTSVLASHVTSVQLAGLHCLASLIYNNTPAGTSLTITTYRGKSLLSLAVYFTGREHGVDIQLAAGRVLTYLYRAEVSILILKQGVTSWGGLKFILNLDKNISAEKLKKYSRKKNKREGKPIN